jgi:hypothetical protein
VNLLLRSKEEMLGGAPVDELTDRREEAQAFQDSSSQARQ